MVGANIYCMIAGQLEFMGTHDLECLPRQGETLIVNRFSEDVAMLVDRVEHKVGPLGHVPKLICSKKGE